MNEKLLNLCLIILFASIIINGMLLMLSATPNGGWIIGLANGDLVYSDLDNKQVVTPNGFISNTSQSQDVSSFNPFTLDGVLAGIASLNIIIQGLFLLEFLFWQMAMWFPVFSPLFLAIACLFVGAKLLLIGYWASIGINALFGRR